jgi:hypothetical protein
LNEVHVVVARSKGSISKEAPGLEFCFWVGADAKQTSLSHDQEKKKKNEVLFDPIKGNPALTRRSNGDDALDGRVSKNGWRLGINKLSRDRLSFLKKRKGKLVESQLNE